MKYAIFSILLLFSIEALSQQQQNRPEQSVAAVASYTDTDYQIIKETREHGKVLIHR